MKAAVYHGHEDVRVEEIPEPSLEESDDVLLRVERTAICGSDLHLWHAEEHPERGFAIGHEFLGTVEETGADVASVRPGDRVLVSCTTGCGRCPSCRRGLYSGCPVTTRNFEVSNVFGFGTALPGGQAEHVRVPFADANCAPLPAGIDDEQALFLTDILPTGFMATEYAEIGPGDTVVVFGCGPVGFFAQQCARVRGAARVVAVDLNADRLQRAAAAGAIPCNPAESDVVTTVLELTSGVGADAAIEAVGVPELVTQAATVTRPGGRVAVVGVILEPWEIQWPLFLAKNLVLRTGLVNPPSYLDRLVHLIREGRLDPAAIISHRFPLSEARSAYELFASRRDDVLKVVLEP